MKRLVHGKRMLFLLVLFLLTSSFITWGQVTTDKFDVYDDSFGTTIDDRAKVEIDWIVITNDYGNKELTITGVRLKVLKGFELSENYLRGSILGSGRFYDLSNFSLLEDKGGWLTYAYASNLLYQFKEVYSCDWKTGAVSRRDYFFYDKGIQIAPVKDPEELYSICNYYTPESASLQDNELILTKRIYLPSSIQFVGGGSAIVIHSETYFEAPGINIDGGEVSLIGEDVISTSFICPIDLRSGTLRLHNSRIFDRLTMTSGSLVLDGERTFLQQVSALGGSIFYKGARNYSISFIETLDIGGNVSIIDESVVSEWHGYLAKAANLKNAVIDIQNNVTDTSCGARRAQPFVREEITIDASSLAFENTDFTEIKRIAIAGVSDVKMKNVLFQRYIEDDTLEPLYLKGGTLEIEDSQFSEGNTMGLNTLLEQEGGLLKIQNSSFIGSILQKETTAKTEILSGCFQGKIEIESGDLDIKGGDIDCVLMKGGALNISGGVIGNFPVLSDCDITLSGGSFRHMLFNEGVTVPKSSSLLAKGYVFARNYINMAFPLGKELTSLKMSIPLAGLELHGIGYIFDRVVPETATLQETPAYKAAKIADVGPNGKDVKVKGTTFEIFTPIGLSWLAVKTNDGIIQLENGKEYLPDRPYEEFIKTKTFKLMSDLDMTGYGTDWPSIRVQHNILDGQGHRVYNLDATSPSPSIIYSVDENGIVANLIVEGNLVKKTVSDRSIYAASDIGGVCGSNSGRIVNCAFIGTILLEDSRITRIGGIVAQNTNTGRIENCYVNPCGELIKGIRPAFTIGTSTYPCRPETHTVAELAGDNAGVITNCYFAGAIDFDNQAQDNSNVSVELPGFANDRKGQGIVTNCYDKSEVSLQTLNKNVQDHQQEKDYPWVTWAVDPNKQCGMPYLVFDGAEPPRNPSIIITGDEPYDPEAHFKANVIVKSGAIYTIDEMEAYIASLTVEDGGQVRLRKPLNVTDSVAVRRYIETDKWTTLCIPEIMMMENNLWDFSLEPEQRPIWSKIGYLDEKTQQWQDYGADNIIPNRAHLYVARFTSQMGLFHTIDINAPFTLKAANTLEAPVNVPDGDWFHFVANPYWENLPIEGRAYVLNEAGTSFDLRENPVIPPFHCYMVASEKVMSEVSSLRLAGIPTSADKVEESGLRVWTESGTLCFETSEAKAVSVYSISGVPQARYERSVGVKRVALPKGVYLLVCEGQAVKVVL